MRVKQILKGLYLVTYPTKRELTTTMLRFAEHYESPNEKFRSGGFSLEEFKKWYRTTRKHGKFSYYTDWAGFNFPGYVLTKFYSGEFKNLSASEKAFLRRFRSADLSKVYMIAIQTGGDALQHETAHGMFYLMPEYRRKAIRLIRANSRKLGAVRSFLKKIGYCDEVLVDECHAWVMCDKEMLTRAKTWNASLEVLSDKLQKLYLEYR